MDMKLREQFIDEDSGVFAISLVSDPAIEKDFIMLSKEVKLSIDKEKRLVTGAILVPDLPIMRLTKDKEPYHIFFSKETVEKASQKYLTDHNQNEVTLEHQVDVNDVILVESWIKVDDNHDKTTALGVEAPNGSWVGSFKVNNDTVWNDIIKTGIVKGFSIEGLFKQTEVEQSKTIIMENKSIIDQIKTLLSGEEKAPEVVVEMATQDEVTKLCKQVETLEETIKGLVGKLEELSKAETEPDFPPNDDNGGRNPQQGPVVVPDPKAETAAIVEEVIEEPKEDEKVEMIAVTDAVEPTFKKVAFDYKLSMEERIRQNIVK